MQLEHNERELLDGNLLRVDNYSGYDFLNNPGFVTFSVCKYEEVVGYDSFGQFILRSDNTDQFFIAKRIIYSATIEMDINVVQNWGVSDDPIFQYVASKIDVVLK